jgi:hypothetical protein
LLEVGSDVVQKYLFWVWERPESEVLFQLLPNLRINEGQRYKVDFPVVQDHNWDISEVH